MELLILGGTFDPVHNGHLHLADTASRFFGGAPVVFVPAFRPAHKAVLGITPVEDRLNMLKEALVGTSWRIETCELNRQETSYTIDTIRILTHRWGLKTLPGLIMGDDLAQGFSQWRRPEEIVAESQIILASRLENPQSFPFPHIPLANPILPLSSSDIRRRVAAGEAFRFLLHPGVYRYVTEKRLYGYRP